MSLKFTLLHIGPPRSSYFFLNFYFFYFYFQTKGIGYGSFLLSLQRKLFNSRPLFYIMNLKQVTFSRYALKLIINTRLSILNRQQSHALST